MLNSKLRQGLSLTITSPLHYLTTLPQTLIMKFSLVYHQYSHNNNPEFKPNALTTSTIF